MPSGATFAAVTTDSDSDLDARLRVTGAAVAARPASATSQARLRVSGPPISATRRRNSVPVDYLHCDLDASAECKGLGAERR